MAIIRKNEFKQMNETQLNQRLIDLRKELMKIRTQISTGTSPENPGRVREVKKTIARILTTLHMEKKEPKEMKTELKKELKKEESKKKSVKEENKKQ